jgi:2-phosphosulfolactate phosphatase
MQVVIEQLLTGARRASGLTVIIDVFRFCTTAAYLFGNGVQGIYPLKTVQEAWALKKRHPDFVLMGERGGIQVEGFDYGNSPSDIEDLDLRGKEVIMTTSAGTQGLAAAAPNAPLLLGSFVTAGALVDHIRRQRPPTVSLVAMGEAGCHPAVEDDACARYLQAALEGRPPDFGAYRQELRQAPSAAKFFDPSQPAFPAADFDCTAALDTFNFVLEVNTVFDGLVVQKALAPPLLSGDSLGNDWQPLR